MLLFFRNAITALRITRLDAVQETPLQTCTAGHTLTGAQHLVRVTEHTDPVSSMSRLRVSVDIRVHGGGYREGGRGAIVLRFCDQRCGSNLFVEGFRV